MSLSDYFIDRFYILRGIPQGIPTIKILRMSIQIATTFTNLYPRHNQGLQ
ncbi:unnamed protein product [Larinioides sclopetarius]|uniref:Uncharacterized protein n=1 Tax=Larinioides sclopetarius TaxID=280406 RepID=A0AAV2BQG3_9ARAC